MLNLSKKAVFIIAFSSLACFTSVNAEINEPVQLNQFLVFSDFIITDNNTVLFNQIPDTFTFDIDLFSTNINGQSDPIFLTNNNFQNFGFEFLYDPDDQRILNLDQLDNGSTITRSTSIDGSSSNILSSGVNPLDVDGLIFQSISSSTLDGTDFYYFVENNVLYTIPVDGSSPASRISPNFPSTSEINFVAPLINRQQIIFSVSDTDSNSEFIYISAIDGSSASSLLTELPENVFIDFNNENTFSFNSDNSRVVFNTESFDESSENTHQIYSLSLNSPSNATPISSPITGFSLDSNFLVFDNTIIYSTENRNANFSQLFNANIDGSSSPLLLDSGLDIIEFELLRNTKVPYVVYTKEVTSDLTEVFSVLIDGSSNPIPLRVDGIDLSSGGSIDSFSITISEKQQLVFYISSQLGNFVDQLFVAPVDGSSPATLISSDEGIVRNIQINNSEESIFYTSESQEFATNELFQSNLDGSNLQKISSGFVGSYQLSSDGIYIVYSSQGSLFSVKLNNQDPESLCFPIKAQNNNFVTICL